MNKINNYITTQFQKIGISYHKIFYKLPQIELDSILDNKIYKLDNIITDDICMPPFLGSEECDDISTIIKIIKHIHPKNILEFGTAHGNTAANICNVLDDVTMYTVNALPEQISGNLKTYVLHKDEIGRVYKKYGFSDYVVQIYQNTLDIELSEYLLDNNIDLAIIDACHDTDFVINDFLKIEQYIINGGLIMLHDTHPSMKNHLFASYYACMKLRKMGFDIRHLKNTWWGIYSKT